MIVLLLMLLIAVADAPPAPLHAEAWRPLQHRRDRDPAPRDPHQAERPGVLKRIGQFFVRLGQASLGWIELPLKLQSLCWGMIGLGGAYFTCRLLGLGRAKS